MSAKQCLDHLILFLPVDPETQLPKLPSFFQKNFTLTPGGHHADGATSNTLILLADGCYIELISFVDPAKAADHWWGPKADVVGWKDWCLTNLLSPEKSHDGVSETHTEPIQGGRKRADGVDVKWAVTFPKGDKGGQDVRGRIPFFCHDITDRSVRVPISTDKITHPCGALGVRELTIIVRDRPLLKEIKAAYASIIGNEGIQRGDESYFRLNRVRDVDALEIGPTIVLRLPKDRKETEASLQAGFSYGDVVLGVEAGVNKRLGSRERIDGSVEDVGGLWLEFV